MRRRDVRRWDEIVDELQRHGALFTEEYSRCDIHYQDQSILTGAAGRGNVQEGGRASIEGSSHGSRRE